MDVVYVVGPDERNDELRLSLRSLAHLEHDRVWIAGYCPPWVQGVGHIPVVQNRGKHRNSTSNLRAACEHRKVSSEFVYMNDDFFILQPMAAVPMLHRGPLAAFLPRLNARQQRMRHRHRSTSYSGGRQETADLLEQLGVAEPLAYEPLHTPMVVDKAGMAEALNKGARIPALHYRTLYGNLAAVGGELSHNHKISDRGRLPEPGWQFVSTEDGAFERGSVGKYLRARFAAPGPYERS